MQSVEAPPLPWIVRTSRSQPSFFYFYNCDTGQSQWERPLATGVGSSSQGPSKVRASHLLVKHSGSRNPSSWREARITRSKEDAIRLLREYQVIESRGEYIRGWLKGKCTFYHHGWNSSHGLMSGGRPLSFAEVCEKYSDCKSAKKGGDLGFFGRGEMQKPFEDAAFSLEVGQFSGIVESDSGVHIIQRTA